MGASSPAQSAVTVASADHVLTLVSSSVSWVGRLYRSYTFGHRAELAAQALSGWVRKSCCDHVKLLNGTICDQGRCLR